MLMCAIKLVSYPSWHYGCLTVLEIRIIQWSALPTKLAYNSYVAASYTRHLGSPTVKYNNIMPPASRGLQGEEKLAEGAHRGRRRLGSEV